MVTKGFSLPPAAIAEIGSFSCSVRRGEAASDDVDLLESFYLFT